ncbi:MaoC/PaaZ C-terminal domain-containing protein [Marihabitans asiaticum]|uniref:MaoC dehydratase-like protein n=1 Tax=Marihabitans asiaticum TaxID=415218 RepID=A0A560W6Q4_9MICO|nr:MaoC/PaaZ C-terminal domain-containing protein [Marihabitans asiaticum]TWD13306.1 MaoC dehydratase-like protein [Marihabitans asiaticum]
MAVETLTETPSLLPVFVKSALGGKKKGDSLPQTSYRLADQVVDRQHLQDYQRLCGFAADDTLPHTYPHILGFPLQMQLMSREDFPLPLVGLVHVENEITVRRRLTAEDVLDITVSAENLAPHPKGTTVQIVTVAEVSGEQVWEGRSTYLARGKGDPDAARGSMPDLPEVSPGQGAAIWSLPKDFGRQYAKISGDVNPIHMSGLTAKAMGFPAAIAHGMWTYARCVATLGPAASGPSSSHVWFKKPVLLPGKVELVVEPGDPTLLGLRKPVRSSADRVVEHLVLTVETR